MSLTPQSLFKPLAFGSAVASSVTNTVVETTLASVIIPAGLMGPNGILMIDFLWTYTSSANAKTLKVTFGGTNIFNVSPTATSTLRRSTQIYNANSASAQNFYRATVNQNTGFTGGGNNTAVINTNNAVTINFTGTLTLLTETIQLEYYWMSIVKSYLN